MATKSETRKQDDQREFTYYIPGYWVTHIAQVIAAGITSVLTVAITVVVTILLLLGGLWLTYTYLPINVLYTILAVLVVDMVLSIVLRASISRR